MVQHIAPSAAGAPGDDVAGSAYRRVDPCGRASASAHAGFGACCLVRVPEHRRHREAHARPRFDAKPLGPPADDSVPQRHGRAQRMQVQARLQGYVRRNAAPVPARNAHAARPCVAAIWMPGCAGGLCRRLPAPGQLQRRICATLRTDAEVSGTRARIDTRDGQRTSALTRSAAPEAACEFRDLLPESVALIGATSTESSWFRTSSPASGTPRGHS